MSYSNDVIEALAYLRSSWIETDHGSAVEAFNVLDNAGVFAALDKQTDYASAEMVLAETYLAGLREQYPNTLDPAEWGDTTSADVAERQMGRHRRIPLDEPLMGAEAERMRIALRQNEI